MGIKSVPVKCHRMKATGFAWQNECGGLESNTYASFVETHDPERAMIECMKLAREAERLFGEPVPARLEIRSPWIDVAEYHRQVMEMCITPDGWDVRDQVLGLCKAVDELQKHVADLEAKGEK